MQHHIYLFIIRHIVFGILIFHHFSHTKALYGHNVRPAQQNEQSFVIKVMFIVPGANVSTDLICTGALVTRHDVISAEHCMQYVEMNNTKFLVGLTDSPQFRFYPNWWISYEQWEQHSDQRKGYLINDFCFIRLTSIVMDEFNTVTFSFYEQKKTSGKRVVVLGWGSLNNNTYPTTLQAADLKVMSKKGCDRQISRVLGRRIQIQENILCTIGDPFTVLMDGDSGSPLLYRNKLIGVSTGICPLVAENVLEDKVNLHINIYYYQEFLLEIISTT
ncbi:PREDICTED: trypsin-like [Ceratosolen solmsi marchali]|uniref:Trypsin-like n=1 Tax=Ceratosolen solmsi marchali TaxID=326594 RepID=A0AAJ7DY25_9HYME|nr:PREDICTED: trypsin-like [Ceratosolen solmsi marchali]